MKRFVSILIGVFVIVFLISGFQSSSFSPLDLVGCYENTLKTKAEVYYYYYVKRARGTVMGCKLDLYENDTFRYECCGAIYTGKYTIQEKKLNLNYTEVQYKTKNVDTSASMLETLKDNGLFDFEIKKNKLIGIITGISSEEKSLNKLIKIHK